MYGVSNYRHSSHQKIFHRHTMGEDLPTHEETLLLHSEDPPADQHQSNHGHRHHRSASLADDVPLYSRPRQRQRWGETQMLPHVNWGDLFFDLFYVAAAFNLDAIMEQEPSLRGLLYFVCCYIPIYSIRAEKLAYDSRYAPDDNLFHRSLEVFHLLILGTIVQHVRPVAVLGATSRYPDTMIFLLSLALECTTHLKRQQDIAKNIDGGPEAKQNARHDILRKQVSGSLYLCGGLIAGYDYFLRPTTMAVNIVPILFAAAGYISEQLSFLFLIFVIIRGSGRSHHDLRVPMNLEFALHRQGEWVMLMLGESILSLLIVPMSAGWRYYITFYTGILAVTMLQYLFFRSQPFEVEDHAMRRSIPGGLLFGQMLVIFSGSLIVFGGSYKLTLDQYILQKTYGPTDIVGIYTMAERSKRIANLSCWSLAVSLLTLDIMILSHRGFKDNFARFRTEGKIQWTPVFIASLNAISILATATMTLWIDKLEIMSVLVLMVLLFQVVLRTRGLRYFPVSKKAMERALNWPNISEPRSATS